MNRQTKRMAQKTDADPRQKVRARQQMVEKRKRTRPGQFLKEVRQELRKVAWPSRKELLAYTTVVLVAVVVLTSIVFALDLVFTKGVLEVLSGTGSG